MPLILAPSEYKRWLSDEPNPRDFAAISSRTDAHVANFDAGQQAGNDDPSILEEVELSPV